MPELGNLRRVHTSVHLILVIDPERYQSGEINSSLSITKHGNAIGQIDNAAKTNSYHIADYYESKKLSFQTKGFKKIAVTSIHKLIRTIYVLIINDQRYNYNVATLCWTSHKKIIIIRLYV